MGLFNKLFRSRDHPKNESLTLSSSKGWLFNTTSAGKVVNPHTAMQTTAVYACVKVIAEANVTYGYY